MYTLTQNDKDCILECATFCAVSLMELNCNPKRYNNDGFVILISQGKDTEDKAGFEFPENFTLPDHWKIFRSMIDRDNSSVVSFRLHAINHPTNETKS